MHRWCNKMPIHAKVIYVFFDITFVTWNGIATKLCVADFFSNLSVRFLEASKLLKTSEQI